MRADHKRIANRLAIGNRPTEDYALFSYTGYQALGMVIAMHDTTTSSKAALPETRNRRKNRGLRHSEITPHGNGFVLSYCFHGSSLIISKDFATLEAAQTAMETLRKASK